MAVKRQPLAIIHNENSEIKRGKPSVAKSGGLKAQQPDLADRKTLSNITNKLKPLSSLGTATPIVARKENNFHNKSSSKALATIKEKKAMRMGPNPRYEITEEMKQKAEMWAREGIEKVNFTGRDMEALQEKMAEEEVDMHVAQALSYRTEIPFWLPRAFVRDPPEIKDHLEILPLENLYSKGGSFLHGMEQKETHAEYDESYLECLEILQNASKDWPTVVEECAW